MDRLARETYCIRIEPHRLDSDSSGIDRKRDYCGYSTYRKNNRIHTEKTFLKEGRNGLSLSLDVRRSNVFSVSKV